MLYICQLFVVITTMPATRRTITRRTTGGEPSSAAPYSLSGASKPQLTALTVAALKSHLKHFKLSTTGKKSVLVDRLLSHLHANSTTASQATVTSNLQQDASHQDGPVNTQVDTEPQQNAPHHADGDAEPRQNAPHQADGNVPALLNVPALPQQLVDQLTTILQQASNSTGGGAAHSGTPQPDAIEDDRLSAASLPVQSNPPLPTTLLPANSSTQVNPPRVSTLLPTPSLLHSTLPPIPTRIQEKIARGEYIDFTTLLSKSMFGAPESQSQTLTLQLSSSGDSYSIRSPTPTANKKITSFAIWMEAWNVYLAVRVSLDPSCASHLIAYQRIITSANSQHPLHAWLSYDTRFRTKAANDSSLRWDIRDLDLWLECFPGTSSQTNRWPCNHCGGTTHYLINCPFRPSTSRDAGGPQPAAVNHQQRTNQVCRDFNRSNCYRVNCKFPHRCDICAGTHPARSCLAKGQPRPR